MRTISLAVAASLALAGPLAAQRFEGIVVVGAGKVAAQRAQVALLGKRDALVDTATTDVFGGFAVKADKPGKYTLMVRRKGFLPMTTEAFELPEGEVLTDTVFLTGRQAEMGVKESLNESLRRVFGASAMSGMSRWIGPDSLAVLRERNITLADLIRTGRLLGVSMPNGTGSGCVRFSGQGYCGQLFLDELPVNLRPDQIFLTDVEAVLAIRGNELGTTVMDTRRFDNSRFGVVMVYSSRFSIR
ncbi:MAG: carboxypeptidase regulatory-like domain-containing protein [Gemmatimonadaceae bacterium]|nr:carboxypeptidase regulatory-like domain-containing protein [Gemmatimonadaceae bacterium]